MRRTIKSLGLLPAVVLIAVCVHAGEGWHHPLYLPGDGYWRQRIPVTVRNDGPQELAGRPAAIRVGSGPGEADMAGTAAQALRVCDAAGNEMLFSLAGPDGQSVTGGPIPAGAPLVIPIECAAGGAAEYYLYFDNPAAGLVPDYLNARAGLVNGDVELGAGPAPSGWTHDAGDEAHRASWSTESPQSGKHCLKPGGAPGAQPTWISTRQHDIPVTGGARYVMRAWVKAENVEGRAGWYIHLGNAQNSMLASPMLDGGGGSYGWKQLTARFTVPDKADRAGLGTVLRGTGTAWFDNVALECLDPGPGKPAVTVGRPQRAALADDPPPATWYQGASAPGRRYDRRAIVRVLHFSDQAMPDGLVCVDLRQLNHRLRGRLDRESLFLVRGGQVVEHRLAIGDTLALRQAVPGRSCLTLELYFSATSDAAPQTPPRPAAVDLGAGNLLKNPGFELGTDMPEGWQPSGLPGKKDGIRFGLDDPGAAGLGRRCAMLHVPPGAAKSWRGWTQAAAVRPGRSYLLAGWIKCRDVDSGEAALHLHLHSASGGLCKQDAMQSVGPGVRGTTGWTLVSRVIRTPADAAKLSVHLTMNQSGTLWHDGLVLAEIVPAGIVRLEGRPLATEEGVRLWPINAIQKVFPDEPVAAAPAAAAIGLARNESEPLQVALRSGRAMAGVRVEVAPLVGPGGAQLEQTVHVVGYVPIDHPTAYYRSDTPAWHRRIPQRPGSCDGWPGLWPDPLLPRAELDLPANMTHAVWITVKAASDARPGDYSGRVRLVHGGATVAQLPVSAHVWNFTLPEENHVAAIYDVRMTARDGWWGAAPAELYDPAVRLMAQRRLCGDRIQPSPKFRYENGQATADFAEFDRAAEVYFHELRMPFSYMPHDFYLFGWGHPPSKKFGEQPYPGQPPFEGADRSQLRPEFKRAYQACLRLFWDHVKQKGWHKRFVLYISDEPYDRHEHIRAQMKALCRMIHEVDPAIPVYSSTWHHVPDWDGSLDIWGIGHDGRVPVEKMAALRAGGARIWFTTDGQMCTDTPCCAVERLLPHYCFKSGAETYEFWGVGWLTYNPYQFGWHAYIHQSGEPGKSTWVRYPNGDGFLIYPGKPIGHPGLVSSIRLEQAREGVEDYEYLYLLGQRVAAAKASGRDASAAERALQQAARLIEIPNAGGRFSTKILPVPDAVLEVKRALAAAIEGSP